MKKTKLTYLTYVAVVLLLVVVSVAGSYAYFTAVINNDGEVYQTVITAGDLRMGFENSQYFNVDDMVIIESSEVEEKAEKSTFDVKNTGNVDASYDLYFNTNITNNLINPDFKWELLVDGESYSSGTFNVITKNTENTTTSATFKITNTPITLTPGAKNSCVFRVWLQDEDRNQISLTEGTMSGNVSIIAVTK